MLHADPDLPDTLQGLTNLASPRMGARIHQVTDDFFAEASRMLADAPPIFKPDVYDDHGKWMDGWESRRRRGLGHDWCVVALGAPGAIHGVDIDTSHFTGNYPRAASIEISDAETPPETDADWTPLLPVTTLGPSQRHVIALPAPARARWARLHIYPDGGVARLRLYGRPEPVWPEQDRAELSSLRAGGRILGYSDAHYGDVAALLSEGRGVTMGDGWETRRRREPGADWIVVALAAPGVVEAVEIDTAHFKGNFPHRASLEAALAESGSDASVIAQAIYWPELLTAQPMQADHIHRFETDALAALGPVSHVKLTIHPDGGVSRLRVFGRPS